MAYGFKIKNEVLVRVYIVCGLLLLFAAAIVFRTFDIAVISAQKWKSLSDKHHVQLMPMPALRGNILSRDGSLLATTQQIFDIKFDPTVVDQQLFDAHIDSLVLCIYNFDSTYTIEAYKEWIVSNRAALNRYLSVFENVNREDVEKIRRFPIFREGKVRGGYIEEPQNIRQMPFGNMARRTIGITNQNGEWTGIEGAYDKVLKGRAGNVPMVRTPGGIWIPIEDLTDIEPSRGLDVRSTLDIGIQDICHTALQQAMLKHRAEWGTAVVMEVKTGAICAMSNLSLNDSIVREDLNHAVRDAIEPGSTFKSATMLALLESEYVKLDDSINLHKGRIRIHDVELTDSEAHGLDMTTVRQAFAKSSNVGMAQLAMQHFGDRDRSQVFVRLLEKFGFGKPCGIDLEGEGKPVLNKPELWSGTTLPWMSFGYELTATPLQLLTFYNAVANDGKMMKPYVVSQLIKDGKVVQNFRPEVLCSQIASKNAIAQLKALLFEAVRTGTGRSLYTSVYPIAGKTGTSQLNYERLNRGTRVGGHRASFVGYFPADNPVYSCIVVINKPTQGSFYGADVAGPVFRKIADRIMATKASTAIVLNKFAKPVLPPTAMPARSAGWLSDIKAVCNAMGLNALSFTKDQWATVKPDTNRVFLLERPIRTDMVPNVVGMGLRDALYVLENAGMRVRINGSGKVVAQSINPGERSRGQTIKIVLR